jgi:hypothetical protein
MYFIVFSICLRVNSPFQIINHLGFPRYIIFIMHLYILYFSVYSKSYESKKPKMTYNLEWREYLAILHSHDSFVARPLPLKQ